MSSSSKGPQGLRVMWLNLTETERERLPRRLAEDRGYTLGDAKLVIEHLLSQDRIPISAGGGAVPGVVTRGRESTVLPDGVEDSFDLEGGLQWWLGDLAAEIPRPRQLPSHKALVANMTPEGGFGPGVKRRFSARASRLLFDAEIFTQGEIGNEGVVVGVDHEVIWFLNHQFDGGFDGDLPSPQFDQGRLPWRICLYKHDHAGDWDFDWDAPDLVLGLTTSELVKEMDFVGDKLFRGEGLLEDIMERISQRLWESTDNSVIASDQRVYMADAAVYAHDLCLAAAKVDDGVDFLSDVARTFSVPLGTLALDEIEEACRIRGNLDFVTMPCLTDFPAALADRRRRDAEREQKYARMRSEEVGASR